MPDALSRRMHYTAILLTPLLDHISFLWPGVQHLTV